MFNLSLMYRLQVQEDLQQLREKLIAQGDNQQTGVDLSALENAIQKTEQGIKVILVM